MLVLLPEFNEVINMKFCKFFPDRRCWHHSCSIFDGNSGSVSVCPLFRGGDFLTARSILPVVRPIFNKHSHGGS